VLIYANMCKNMYLLPTKNIYLLPTNCTPMKLSLLHVSAFDNTIWREYAYISKYIVLKQIIVSGKW